MTKKKQSLVKTIKENEDMKELILDSLFHHPNEEHKETEPNG